MQELLKRLQDRHGECAQAVAKAEKAVTNAPKLPKPNVIQVMMMLQVAQQVAKTSQDRAKTTQDQAKVANKVALEAEKDNDVLKKKCKSCNG